MAAGTQHKTDVAGIVTAINTAKTNLADPSKNGSSTEVERAGLRVLIRDLERVITRHKSNIAGLV
jgi:hypothetical protein